MLCGERRNEIQDISEGAPPWDFIPFVIKGSKIDHGR